MTRPLGTAMSIARKSCRAWLTILLAVVAWAAFAAWQYHEYGHERDWARHAKSRQAALLMGGISHHRRLGNVQCERLEATLQDLADSGEILAAAIVGQDGEPLMTAGRAELLSAPSLRQIGEFWDETGFRYAAAFYAETSPGVRHGPGGGRGRGWGRQMRQSAAEAGDSATGERLAAVVLFDRSATDEATGRAARARIGVVIAGGLVLGCVALAWWTSVRLIEERGRARVLEAEARHLGDLSQVAAGLAHETRNPLSLIRGWTQRLADADGEPLEHRRQAQAVIEECDRVTARINQFLAFARPRAPQPARLDLRALVEELRVLLEPDLEAKQLSLACGDSCIGRSVEADREMLRQALFNLVGNAIQFAPEQGCVEISLCSGANGACRVEVADRGPGVAPQRVESLFTPYFTTRSDGTGLGLAIVRRIAELHGWRAGYRPRAGGGSVFYLDGIHA